MRQNEVTTFTSVGFTGGEKRVTTQLVTIDILFH